MKLAIIMPVYNGQDTVRRAVTSIDTKVEFEIICINDGSTDNTKHELTELQKNFLILKSFIKRIKVLLEVVMLD